MNKLIVCVTSLLAFCSTASAEPALTEDPRAFCDRLSAYDGPVTILFAPDGEWLPYNCMRTETFSENMLHFLIHDAGYGDAGLALVKSCASTRRPNPSSVLHCALDTLGGDESLLFEPLADHAKTKLLSNTKALDRLKTHALVLDAKFKPTFAVPLNTLYD